MKIELTERGWKEISTKYIIITMFSKNPFMKVGDWIKSNKKIFRKTPQKRISCYKCRKKWKDIPLESSVNLVFTNDGNKIICEQCHTELVSNNKSLQDGRAVEA